MARNGNTVLNDIQWLEIERRHLAGESLSSLAKEYKVGVATLTRRGISKRCEEIRSVANQLVEAEQRLEALPAGEQINARHLANELKAISMHLASAAKYGSMTANRMNQFAHQQTEKIDPDAVNQDEWDANRESMRNVAAFTELANKSATIGLNLLAANKEAVKEHVLGNVIDITPSLIPDDPVQASLAYQRMIQGG